MFTAGVGYLEDCHKFKSSPEIGLLVCKIGGPAYRIGKKIIEFWLIFLFRLIGNLGIGGGSTSSHIIQSDNMLEREIQFNAVQRGDAEMENRMNRFLRGCIELGEANPILSIHDQVSSIQAFVLICD